MAKKKSTQKKRIASSNQRLPRDTKKTTKTKKA